MRGHNEGTIAERKYKLKGGTTTIKYIAQLPLNEQGKRPSVGSFDTKAEARDALKQATFAQSQGFVVSRTVPTVEKWCEQWLNGRTKISYSTRAGYMASLSIMCTYIGHIRLDQLQESDIAEMWEKLRVGETNDGTPRQPLRLTTLHRYHAHLKAALAAAVRNRTIPLAWNAAAAGEARPERGERKDINPLTEEEVRQLFATTEHSPLYAFFVTLVTTGIRHGEAQALHWDDLDLKHLRVSVRHSLHRETGTGLVLGPTKTRRTRSVSLRPETAAVLRAHQAQQAEMRLRAGTTWHDGDFVFTTQTGRSLDQNRIQRAFDHACRDANIARRSVKELRHTFATLALINGVHPKVVQEAMGHTSIAITLDTYSHLVPNLQSDAMNHLDRLFG